MSEKWTYWLSQYLETWCIAQGLAVQSLKAYSETLRRFRDYAMAHWPEQGPDRLTARDILEYVEHLRRDRNNGDAAVNRTVTILKNFYRAMVSTGQIEPDDNPLAHFPKLKRPSRKLPEILSEQEMPQLLDQPPSDTIIGLRDRALLATLYGTGIRASECSGLDEKDVDLALSTIRVKGKGGHERVVPLNEMVVKAMRTSTQIYLHMTARDMREAADRHPIAALMDTVNPTTQICTAAPGRGASSTSLPAAPPLFVKRGAGRADGRDNVTEKTFRRPSNP